MIISIKGSKTNENIKKALELAKEKDFENIVIYSDKEKYKTNFENYNEFWNIKVESFSDEYVFHEDTPLYNTKEPDEKDCLIIDLQVDKYSSVGFNDPKFWCTDLDEYQFLELVDLSESWVTVIFIFEQGDLEKTKSVLETMNDSLPDINNLILSYSDKIIHNFCKCHICWNDTILNELKDWKSVPICKKCFL